MHPIDSLAVPILEAIRLSGMGRTKLYQEINAGRIKARKLGKRTLIEMRSLRAYLDALPPYETKSPANRRANGSDSTRSR